MQIKTITSWYKRHETIPNIFYLDWPNNPEWITDLPIKSKFLCQVNCTKMGEIINFYASEKTAELLKTPYKIEQDSLYKSTHISILKSHLQKCIRRCLMKKAVQTAYSMALIRENGQYLGLQELLRRLMIITIEDCILTKHYLKLAWLMSVTHKDIKLHESMLEWIFGYVAYLADLKWNDVPNMELNAKIKITELVKDLEPVHQHLLSAIQLRASYNGMDCDVKMLDNMSQIWRDRFVNKKGWEYAILETEEEMDVIKLKDLKILLPKNIILPAIDFHCCNMIMILHERTGIKTSELEKLIWINRSSINYKVTEKIRMYNYNKTEWNKIADLVNEISENFIKERFDKEGIKSAY